MITLFIIDDCESTRQALVHRLNRVPGIQVVGCAATSRDGISQARTLHPDVVLLEPKLADGRGLEALPAIRTDHLATRVIILTSHVDDRELEVAMRQGAERYLLKDLDAHRLTNLILGCPKACGEPPTQEFEMMQTDLIHDTDTVIVPDVGAFTIRPIRRDDAPRLQAFHARLSPHSIYMRFLSYHMTLSNEEAEHFTSIDYQTRMALVAVQEQEGDEHLRGVARYDIIDADRPDTAEAAIIVEDQYQRKGLGVLLANRLASYAKAHGIRAFVAEISSGNSEMLRFVERTGLPIEKKRESGVWKIRLQLRDDV